MYHKYRKDSSYVREALYSVYGGKCAYCNHKIEYRHMHVDHILPTNIDVVDNTVQCYIQELNAAGFIQDSLENYLPACQDCNLKRLLYDFVIDFC